MLVSAAKRLVGGARVSKSVTSRPVRRFNSTQESELFSKLDARSDALLAEAAKAPRVSAVAAKLAWEAEQGIFVDLRTSPTITIDGFERIPSDSLARSFSRIEEAAKAANTKNIYFLDVSGYHSSVAANLLKKSAQFSGYNPQAIEGGLSEWVADMGPFTAPQAGVQSLLDKLREQSDPALETFDEQFSTQLNASLGLTPKPHDMLILNEETGEVVANPLPRDAITHDAESFKQWMQKMKL